MRSTISGERKFIREQLQSHVSAPPLRAVSQNINLEVEKSYLVALHLCSLFQTSPPAAAH